MVMKKKSFQALKNFRDANPPTFPGGTHLELRVWMHEVEIIFKLCQTPEEHRLDLASTLLKGEIWEYWAGLRDTSAHNSWYELRMALHHHLLPPPEVPVIPETTTEPTSEDASPSDSEPTLALEPAPEIEPHPSSSIHPDLEPAGLYYMMGNLPVPMYSEYVEEGYPWSRKPEEDMTTYAGRFEREVLNRMGDLDGYHTDLIYLFWSEVPEDLRRWNDFPPTPTTTIMEFMREVVSSEGSRREDDQRKERLRRREIARGKRIRID